MKRRDFLKHAALGTATGFLFTGQRAWALPSITDHSQNRKRLVVILLRGAVDGLNIVAPYAENHYYEGRPTIAIPKPGSTDGLLDLDGYFGLNPALDSLYPLWQQGSLGFIHASGSPDPTRSHFDAQYYMESGTPGIKTTADGWINRMLAELPGEHASTQAISFGATLPKAMSGKISVANIAVGKRATKPMPLDRPEIVKHFDRLYSGNDILSLAYREGQEARKQLLSELNDDMQASDQGAPSPIGFVEDATHLAKLMVGSPATQVAFMSLGGWDTHVNQGSSRGQLTNHLKPLGEGLARLVQQLGPLYRDTVILVMSEFGRTVRENGNGGTDHGHGNVMWVMGGNVRGGKVYGDWPGLVENSLYQGRDLAVTTDFRAPLASLLKNHMQLIDAQIQNILPGDSFRSKSFVNLMRS